MHVTIPQQRPHAPGQDTPLLSEAAPSPRATQIAAQWAGRALDPRGGLKLMGRAGVALGALALQVPSAAAAVYRKTDTDCLEYKNFQSPSTGAAYALDGDCDGFQGYFNRLINTCRAVAVSDLDPHSWTFVDGWTNNPALYRQTASPAAADATFEACLNKELLAENKHQAGIIMGIFFGITGGGLVLMGAVAGARQAYLAVRRMQADRRAAAAAAVPAPTLPRAPVLPLPGEFVTIELNSLPPEGPRAG